MSEGERPSQLSAGSVFAGYRIERRLGQGGMGLVFEATEPGLERRVALKLIIPEVITETVFLERFKFESKIAAQVEHPNVVPIYAAGEHEGVPYIAMRLVSGSDLGKRLAVSGRLEPELATDLIAQISHGLDAIHAAGLVHRDVKPGNVLVSGEAGSEHAYITDFGVARNVASTSGLTKTGRFVGTLDYVAPEQIVGDEVDARADIYALACLLFKCLTGEVPFPKEGEAARLYAHLHDEPPAASLFTPLVPKALDAVIARGMAKRPDDRYPSAGDLGRAAQAALRGEPVRRAERSVATGAALTAERESIEAAGPTGPAAEPEAPLDRTRDAGTGGDRPGEPPAPETEGEVPPPPSGEPPPTSEPSSPTEPPAPTGEPPASDETPPSSSAPPHGRPDPIPVRRRRLLVGLAGIAVVGVIAFAIASSGGGGGGGSGSTTTANNTTGATGQTGTTGQQGNNQGANGGQGQANGPRLTPARLRKLANDNCIASQDSFNTANAAFQQNGDHLAFAQARFDTSDAELNDKQNGFNNLNPPLSMANDFNKFRDEVRLVHQFDTEALQAAKQGNQAGIDRANAKNAAREPKRFELANRLGFKDCNRHKQAAPTVG